jgi:ribose 5-phosphate isomerase A
VSDADQKTRRAAEAALAHLADESVIGVGTGSTVNVLIETLAANRRHVRAAVSSSNTSTTLLRRAGIEVIDLNSVERLSLYIDGADEALRDRCLIKGGGGALTREKIIAAAAERFICIVDESKLVERLGRFPLPVEVIPMARSYVARRLASQGGRPVWRQDFVTDNGNHILDVHSLSIVDPARLETEINQIAGVVTVGLFAHRRADVLIVGTDAGVEII